MKNTFQTQSQAVTPFALGIPPASVVSIDANYLPALIYEDQT